MKRDAMDQDLPPLDWQNFLLALALVCGSLATFIGGYL